MSLAFWRDLAIVWLALLCFIGMAVPLVIAFFAVKGTGAVLGRAPALLAKAHHVSRRMREQTDAGSRLVVTRVEDVEHRIRRIADAVPRLGSRRTARSR